MTAPKDAKNDKVWTDWLALTESARQPEQAPRPIANYGRLPVGMAALAAVAIIVIVMGSRLVAPPVGPGGSPSASPSASASASAAGSAATSAQPSATATPSPIPTATSVPTLAPTASPFGSPTPAGKSVTFTTPGVDSNWSGVAWSTLPAGSPLLLADPGLKVIPWRGGYAAYGSTGGGTKGFLWTSTDGLTWRVVTSFTAQQIVAAASPTGLVAVTGTPDSPSAPQTVWTSTDGVTWHKAGTPTGIGTIDTIAGTSAGLVATGHTLKGTGKSATAQFGVAFSTDGLNWTPVAVGHGIAWDYIGPAVQSGNGRFFVMGGYTGGTASGYRPVLASLTKPGMPGSGALNSGAGTGGLWWSDDGRTWTSASDTAYVSGLDFARDGIEMIWSYRAVPGGTGLQFSSDGGKTWGKSQDPLGDSVCGQGECSTGPDGVIGSNGTYLLAVKSNGKAWVSSDGKTWTSMAWDGSLATGSILVLPRGVVVDGKYGAAK